MVTRLPLAGAAALLLSAAAPAFAAPGCAERLLPPAATGPVSPMTARALVELRDFGRSDSAVAGGGAGGGGGAVQRLARRQERCHGGAPCRSRCR